MFAQLPLRNGVTTITPREYRRIARTVAVDSEGSDKMQVDLLSSIVTFHVGSNVSDGSWGTRIDRPPAKPQAMWMPHDFVWKKMIGSGHFGTVHLGLYIGSTGRTHNAHSHQVAIKSFDKHRVLAKERCNKSRLTLLQREISIHSSLDHPSIVNFHGFYEDPKSFNLVLEYFEEGDLFDYLRRRSLKPFSERRISIARKVLQQLASALAYIHRLSFVHRDIKPENILVRRVRGNGVDGGTSSSTQGGASSLTFALTDFGWACSWKPDEYRHTFCGTLEYVSPEMIPEPCSYQAKYVDYWALGVLACEMLQCSTPFALNNSQDSDETFDSERDRTLQSIRTFDPHYYFASIPHCPASDFCFRLMQRHPLHRMTADSALAHEYLRPLNVVPVVVTPTTAMSGAMVAQRRVSLIHEGHVSTMMR
ncbi:spindle assembly checkpoint kinase [Mayamaea pseudoterrestris]|nr:spindle assembly checkpoint kinase [Mayamaea pseudoterrestris]